MNTSFALNYRPLTDGGIELAITHPSVSLTIPLDRSGALRVAASVLHGAGVREAAFSDGRLTVLAEQ